MRKEFFHFEVKSSFNFARMCHLHPSMISSKEFLQFYAVFCQRHTKMAIYTPTQQRQRWNSFFLKKIPFKVHKFLLPVAHTDYRRSHMRLQLKNITRKLVVYRHVLVMDSNSSISHSFMCGIKIAIIRVWGWRTNSSRNLISCQDIAFTFRLSPHRRRDKK